MGLKKDKNLRESAKSARKIGQARRRVNTASCDPIAGLNYIDKAIFADLELYMKFFLMAASGMMISMMLDIPLSASPMNAMVKEVTGHADYASPGSTNYQTLGPGASLVSGTIIRTGADGVVTLVPVRGTALRIAQNSELTVSNMDFAVDGDKVTSRKADIDLASGVVTALLDENIPADVTDFKVHTPQGVAVARGTFFAVCVQGDKSYVKVRAGKVGVQSKLSNNTQSGQASYLPSSVTPG